MSSAVLAAAVKRKSTWQCGGGVQGAVMERNVDLCVWGNYGAFSCCRGPLKTRHWYLPGHYGGAVGRKLVV